MQSNPAGDETRDMIENIAIAALLIGYLREIVSDLHARSPCHLTKRQCEFLILRSDSKVEEN